MHDSAIIQKQEKKKPRHGWNIGVLVKNKVALPHEAILGGVSSSWLSYDKLSMLQFMMGFCRNIMDEKSLHER